MAIKKCFPYLLIFLFTLGVMLFLYTYVDRAYGDTYYHLALANFIKEHGLSRQYEHLAFTVYEDTFSDGHFLFHVAHVLFCTQTEVQSPLCLRFPLQLDVLCVSLSAHTCRHCRILFHIKSKTYCVETCSSGVSSGHSGHRRLPVFPEQSHVSQNSVDRWTA